MVVPLNGRTHKLVVGLVYTTTASWWNTENHLINANIYLLAEKVIEIMFLFPLFFLLSYYFIYFFIGVIPSFPRSSLSKSHTVDKTAIWPPLITFITLMMNNNLCCQSTNMPGYKSNGPEAGIAKQFKIWILNCFAIPAITFVMLEKQHSAFYMGIHLPLTIHDSVSSKSTDLSLLRKEIYQMWICLCSPTLTAAGEAHLNANILLLLKQMWQLMSWLCECNFSPSNDISDSILREMSILMTHNTAGGLVKLVY